MLNIVYFSNVSENTKRFVDKLGFLSLRIPFNKNEKQIEVSSPYVLVVPTYGNGDDETGVPKQVIKFLNIKKNRDLIKGVIGSGNTNFGSKYCYAGQLISKKCRVPLLHQVELMGTDNDVVIVQKKVRDLWNQF